MENRKTEHQPNMTGKTVVITGSTGGIGFQSALELAKQGAQMILIGRDEFRGKAAVEQIRKVVNHNQIHLVLGQLSSASNIDMLAHQILSKVSQIDVLINNAGYLGNELRYNDDGLEMHFAINVFAVWRLTHALLPALKAAPSARVINITGGDKPAAVDVFNLQAEKKFRGLMTYTHSKSILEAMSVALSRKLDADQISVNVVFPGRASTSMTRSLSLKGLPGPMKLMMPLFKLLFKEDDGKSARKASRSTIFAATHSSLHQKTGCYFDTHCVEQKMHVSAYDSHVHQHILNLIE